MLTLILCFNTQPPEGGWINQVDLKDGLMMFQHTAARRRLGLYCHFYAIFQRFQHTAARRRLGRARARRQVCLCFNTQPPEGGWIFIAAIDNQLDSFNTQPPEGGWSWRSLRQIPAPSFQHTAARRRLVFITCVYRCNIVFQHTAARRRLVKCCLALLI